MVPPPSQMIAARTWIDLKTRYQFVFARKTAATARPMIGPTMPIHWKRDRVVSAGACAPMVVCVMAKVNPNLKPGSRLADPDRHRPVRSQRMKAVPPERCARAVETARVVPRIEPSVDCDVADAQACYVPSPGPAG